MRTILLAAVTLVAFADCRAAEVKSHSLLTSPNGRIDVAPSVDAHGRPRYEVDDDESTSSTRQPNPLRSGDARNKPALLAHPTSVQHRHSWSR